MKGWDASTIERLRNKGLVINDSDTFKSVKNFPEKEDDIQRQCFAWFSFTYPAYVKRIFHIPNGGKRDKKTVTNKKTGETYSYSPSATALKKMGTVAGVWDIFLSVPKKGFAGLYIEMKAGNNGLTDNQEDFREANKNDYEFKVCYSLEEFMKVIKDYLTATT